MIVYSATRKEFSDDVISNQIELRILDAFKTRLKRYLATVEDSLEGATVREIEVQA